MKSFGKMKILLDIYGDMKEQMREEARKKLDKDQDRYSRYDKSILKLGQKIEKNIG
jgi:Tfp pilus assembly protein PilF